MPLDRRSRVPVAQNLLYRSRAAALASPTGILDMLRCMACGFAWNAAFDAALVDYAGDYESDQSHSDAYRRHLGAVADVVETALGDREAVRAVEIGCGQGQVLALLAERLGPRAESLVGFDPSFRASSPLPAGARVERVYFTEATRHLVGAGPDLVVTRHVIEHVADPLGFLATIRAACDDGAALVVETPNLQWILDGAVIQDLYYEHCSLFDAPALARALRAAGFEAVEVSEAFGGQYLLAVARAGKASFAPRSAAVDAASYPARRAAALARLEAAVAADAASGETVALWGGASKGVTLALLLAERLRDVALAIDINPVRTGCFMPLTGLPVVAPEAARTAGVTKAWVMNPAYLPEIEAWCRDQDWPLKLAVID